MGALKNARHELFAQALAKGRTPEDAYRDAGFKPARQNAHRLMTNDDVSTRVAEIKDKAAARVVVTVESLAVELEEARTIAIAEKQSAAAVSASMGKAKLFGLGVENRNVKGTLQIVSITQDQIDGLTDEEIDALDRAQPVLRKLGILPPLGGQEAPA